jgi:phytanoyl-CoA hydroxylase
MSATAAPAALVSSIVSAEELEFFHREGYLVKRSLFSKEECDQLIQHFMTMHKERRIPGYTFVDEKDAGGDALKVYPRIMMPHRFDELARRWLLDTRVVEVLRALLAEEPIATQSMMYFKPPGARGQAFHQDNFYLKVKPKSCIASWVALEKTDPENGGLQVCPRTQNIDVKCPETANLDLSFSRELVPPPDGTTPVPVLLEPGDTLFFNGSVVHGSTPNYSKTRFRRSYICHYAPESMQEMAHWYFPLLDMNGNVVERAGAPGGGPCGTEVKGNH